MKNIVAITIPWLQVISVGSGIEFGAVLAVQVGLIWILIK